MKQAWIYKLMGLFLVLSLLLVACSSNETPTADEPSLDEPATDEVVTVTFWKAPHSEKEAEIWAEIIADFEADNPNIKIEHVITPWDTWGEKYTSGFASDSPPDVSYMVDWWSAKYAFAGQFVDLDAAGYSDEVKGDYSENVWAVPYIDGHQVGIPFMTVPRHIFYNTDMFDAAGLDYPTADWTWDDFMEAARALTTDDHYGFVQPSTYAGRGYSDYLQWLWGAGGDVLNEDMTKALVNTPEAVTALDFVINMFEEGVVPPHGQYDDVSQEDLFMRQGVAMCACRATTISQLRSDFPEVNYGLVLPPKGPAGNQISFADWGFFSIAEASPHKEAAWTWLKHITSKEITIKYIEQIGLTPAMSGTGLFEGDPEVYFFVENVNHVKNIPIHPQVEEILQVWWSEVEAAIQGTISAVDASDNAAAAIDAILQE